MTFKNKTLLITGGTSRLGECVVRKAVSSGAKTYFTYKKNQQKADELKALGARAFQLELSSTAAIDAFCKILKEEMQHLDVLIHNAAEVRDHTIQNLTEEDWDKVLAVNLKAPYYLTKKLLPLLFRKKKKENETPVCNLEDEGRRISQTKILRCAQDDKNSQPSKILFITSRAAVTGGFGISNYAAAKAGLIGLTKSLAQELGKKQILVNAVNPGFMISAMTEKLPEAVLQHHLELSSIQRYSNPEEVAGFLLYLCSDQMTQVTGQIFHFESRKI